MLYDKVKYGVNMYQLKEMYSDDYIALNIDYAVSHQDTDDMVQGIIPNYKGKDYITVRMCPYCGECYTGYPAISRVDNKTEICPNCGIEEAIEAAMGKED